MTKSTSSDSDDERQCNARPCSDRIVAGNVPESKQAYPPFWLNLYSRGFPEFARFGDALAATQAHRQAKREAPRVGLVVIGVVMTLVCAAISFYDVVVRSSPAVLLSWNLTELAMFGAVVGSLVLMATWTRKPIQRSLRRQLCEHGLPVCVSCGYDLRGLTEPRCPECGETILLHTAIGLGNTEIVKALFDGDAEVNVKTHEGATPLHLAAKMGNRAVVQVLLGAGGDVNAETNDHWTPLFVARKNGHDQVAALLVEHGGRE